MEMMKREKLTRLKSSDGIIGEKAKMAITMETVETITQGPWDGFRSKLNPEQGPSIYSINKI